MKRELIEMLCRKSFRYSEEPVFKLVSGKLSNFYVNCKPTTLSARGMYLAGQLVFNALEGVEVSAVGGLTFGADPIAIACIFRLKSMEEIEEAFPGSLYESLIDHFTEEDTGG